MGYLYIAQLLHHWLLVQLWPPVCGCPGANWCWWGTVVSTNACSNKAAQAQSSNFQLLVLEARAEDTQCEQKWNVSLCIHPLSHPSAYLCTFCYCLSLAFPTVEFVKWWDMMLNLAHLVLVTVRSVSLLQNNYPSHCGPCSSEVCRHLGLSSHPAFLIFRDLFSLASQTQNTSPHLQCPTEVPKAFILLKSCCKSKCFWDFPPGKLCLLPCCACPENTQETQYASGRETRCFPHFFISNHQLLNECSNQLSCGSLMCLS